MFKLILRLVGSAMQIEINLNTTLIKTDLILSSPSKTGSVELL